jgi:hypothetical protein
MVVVLRNMELPVTRYSAPSGRPEVARKAQKHTVVAWQERDSVNGMLPNTKAGKLY